MIKISIFNSKAGFIQNAPNLAFNGKLYSVRCALIRITTLKTNTMKKLILLFAVCLVVSCTISPPPVPIDTAVLVFQAGYLNGAANVLRNGTYDKNQWVADSLKMDKIMRCK